jgi:hypothetical protein
VPARAAKLPHGIAFTYLPACAHFLQAFDTAQIDVTLDISILKRLVQWHGNPGVFAFLDGFNLIEFCQACGVDFPNFTFDSRPG